MHVITSVSAKRGLTPLADFKSRVLILDMLPTDKSQILQQYYPNKSNSFWKILFRIYREPQHSDYKLKKQMLLRNGIALWNVLEHERGENQTNDFQTFFQMYPQVNRVIFNGINAAACYNANIGYIPGISYVTLPSTSSLNTWTSLEEKVQAWSKELKK